MHPKCVSILQYVINQVIVFKNHTMKNNVVELIQRILSDDEAAFTELVNEYKKQVHALAWRKVEDFQIAEDITQEVFLKVFQELHTLRDPNLFPG